MGKKEREREMVIHLVLREKCALCFLIEQLEGGDSRHGVQNPVPSALYTQLLHSFLGFGSVR